MKSYPITPWIDFQLTIGVIGVVIIRDYDYQESNGLITDGEAGVGYILGSIFNEFRLRRDLTEPLRLNRTVLHELGHVLGLQHEHQRADRDDWITVTGTGYNYDKIPQYNDNWHWECQQVRVGWWTISIWYPVFWRTDVSVMSGSFDLKSIMLYNFFKLKNSNNWVDTNNSLSTGDIDAVKRLYP